MIKICRDSYRFGFPVFIGPECQQHKDPLQIAGPGTGSYIGWRPFVFFALVALV